MISFEKFYQEIYGYEPRQWQSELAEKIASDGHWMKAVSAITGAGKTSTIPIAVWTLYSQIKSGQERTLPLRICLSVERKLIVDEAYNFSKIMIDAIENNEALNDVRTALRSLLPDFMAQDDKVPTIIGLSMHSSSSWDSMWIRPVGCTIITGTMTQITSRILFRGVGEGKFTKSISAGILGTDTLRLLDEPHLMIPAVRTLYQQQEMVTNNKPQTVILGATLPSSIKPNDDECFHARVDDSIKRYRPATFIEKGTESQAVNEISKIAKEKYLEGKECVVIVSNKNAAQKVSQNLQSGKGKNHVDVRVITSDIRPCDRSEISFPSKDFVTVATQTIEVGVDYDAEVIISDLAPLPSLKQRNGRAGRTGRDAEFICVTPEREKVEKMTNSFVYDSESLLATYDVIHNDLESLDDIDDLPEDTWVKEPMMVDLEENMAQLLSNPYAVSVPWESFIYGTGKEENSASVQVMWRDQPHLAKHVIPSQEECIEVPIYKIIQLNNSKRSIRKPFIFRRDNIKGFVCYQCKNYREIEPGDTIIFNTKDGLYDKNIGFMESIEDKVDDCTLATRNAVDVLRKSKEFIFLPPQILYSQDKLEKHLEGIEEIELDDGDKWCNNGSLIKRTIKDKSKVKKDKSVVYLADHLYQVGKTAKEISEKSNSFISPEDYELAGQHHDIGKINRHFQRNVLGNSSDENPWAKSCYLSDDSQDETIEPTPQRWRHESLVAQQIQDISPHAAYLVAEHHGRGTIHEMGGKVYKICQEPQDLSVWDLAYASSVFRYSDWLASIEPVEYGLTMDDLDVLIPTDETFVPEEISNDDQNIVELTGLYVQKYSGLMAAFGVLAAISEVDPNSQLLIDDGNIFVSSSADIEFTPPKEFGKDDIGKNNVVKSYDLPQYLTNDYWRGVSSKGETEPRRLATAIIHNNGSPIPNMLSCNDYESPLFDPNAGWSEDTKCNFSEFIDHKVENCEQPLYRNAIYAWILKAQLSWGAPSSIYGSGTCHKSLCIPILPQWMDQEMAKFAAQGGFGLHMKLAKIGDYQSYWMPEQ